MALLTEEQQTVAVTALATTLGKPVSEIETILTGETPNQVDTMVSERLKKVLKDGKDGGKGELQKIANRKAKELFGTDATDVATIEDLLSAVKASYTPPVDPTLLTEEQVKTHPAFRTLETTLANKETQHQQALDKARTEAKAEVDQERLRVKAIKALTDFGAVISEDPKIAAVQERMFLEGLNGISTKEVDGKIEFWKADGEGNLKRIETDKLLPVAEADFFKGLVEGTYTTKVSEQRSSTGLPPNSGQQQQQFNGTFTHFKGTAPKTLDEYNNILRDKANNTFEAREEVTKYWNDLNKK